MATGARCSHNNSEAQDPPTAFDCRVVAVAKVLKAPARFVDVDPNIDSRVSRPIQANDGEEEWMLLTGKDHDGSMNLIRDDNMRR